MSRYTPPRTEPQLRERGVAYVEVSGKERPAIVIRIFKAEGRALVVCGTGTSRSELAVVAVPETSAAGRALRLTKATYFYGDALKSVKLDYLKPTAGLCPPELFFQVRLLVEGALLTLAPGALLKDLPDEAAAPHSLAGSGMEP